MHLIDTHTHLYLSSFKNDIDKVIARAVDNGVTKMFLPNIDSGTINSMNKIADDYTEYCFPMIGLHPTSVNGDFEKELRIIESEVSSGKYIAVGETGIDLYHDKTYLKEQLKAFERQIRFALEFNLPVIIHARDSFNELFETLKKYKNSGLKGVFHAFTGTVSQADYIINELNFMLGIGGIVTFKNSGLDRVVKEIDLSHIVLETDSPFLAPVPRRGKRNESSYLVFIAEKISQIMNINQDEVAEITTNNAYSIFGK
ncbi:MAG: TatD family hydrolase [Bacteroidales bacterium]|nr:MAG: TatD family hydrolase [Bacteroidales bacterium]